MAVVQQVGTPAPVSPAPPAIPALPSRAGAATGAQQAATQAADAAADAVDQALGSQSTADQVREIVRREVQNAVERQQGEAITVVQPPFREPEIPPEVISIVEVVFGSLIAIVLGYPIIRFITRVIEKRMDRSLVKAAEVEKRYHSLQQSMDAMAIEIERIGEAQRFQAKLMADRADRVALPADGERR